LIKEIKDDLRNLTVDSKSLKRFLISLSLLGFIISGLLFLTKNVYFFIPAFLVFVFIILVLIFHKFLKLFFRLFMFFSLTLNWIISRIILIFIFYFLITNIGLLLKLFKKDVLDLKIEKSKKSYWKNKETIIVNSRYKKMF
jgi:hypothetical protein